MRSRPTIGEVAERANVAASTVSRVLNGGYASAAVRARVEQVVRELGYTPSPTARNLKMGRTGIIGVVVESSRGAWFMDLLSGIEDELTEKQVSVVLGSLWLHGTYDLRVVQSWIADRRVDGLIFARPGQPQRPLIRAARTAKIPMAFIGPDEHFEVGHELSAQNRQAGSDIARHLADLGHKRMAFAAGPEGALDIQERRRGLAEGAAARGIELRDEHVWYTGSYYAEEGTRHAERWLALDRAAAPTAVVVGNDSMALGFMRRVLQAGVKIPQELSVVGFDGIPEGAMYFPSLTTARQPMHQIGVEACRSLLNAIQHPDAAIPEASHYPMELVVRESTGRAPSS